VVQGTETGTRVIRLAWPDVGPEELAALAEVLASGFLTMGPKVQEFEAALARACHTEHAVAVSSGTAALHLAVLALGIGEGDEVIVPAYTFPATANAVALAGARPVLVDVGRPLDWEALQSAVPPDVALVEDAAGALGARWRGMPCGGLGMLGCLSFHPRKIVTTGEGGAVTTSDDALAGAVRRLRHHGIAPRGDFEIPVPSTNYRLSDLHCAIGITQLARLRELLAARRRVAEAYNERLQGIVQTPSADEGDEHGWQAYIVQLGDRDDALAALRAEGIEAQIGTYALHRLGAFHDQGPFPGADRCFERALALPLHSRLTEEDIELVCGALTRLVS